MYRFTMQGLFYFVATDAAQLSDKGSLKVAKLLDRYQVMLKHLRAHNTKPIQAQALPKVVKTRHLTRDI